MTLKSRLRRAEAAKGGSCERCGLSPDGPGRIVLISDGVPGEGFPENPDERCGNCGRPLWCVIRVVYDSPDKEGGDRDA